MSIRDAQVGTAPRSANVITIRPPHEGDLAALTAIVNENARAGHLLPRSEASIRASLPDWLIAEIDGVLVGCGSLLLMGPQLVEVRSLAVLPAYRSYGIGAKIVMALVEEARRRGYATVFALTRAVAFFLKLGFALTNKERFPEKVWRDCAICPLQTRCDETAVVIELDRVTR
ncbi:MAG: GNAT family N-acetyltransferase [Roseiflexaceae bacterium]|nr:GNAT family N-acetyltransferase [Roseiflexaceae bacterium]